MANKKIDPGLFESAVRFHIGNLRRGISCEEIRDGVMYFRGDGHKSVPVEVGEENSQHWNKGLLFFFNGSDIVSYMKDVEIIPSDTPRNYERVDDIPQFLEKMSTMRKKDGAIIYDRHSRAYTNAKVNENAPAVRKIEGGLERLLPKNFISDDESIPIVDTTDGSSNIGCRTQAAFKTTRGFDTGDGLYHHIYAILIKQTACNPLGLGTLSYITDDSLDMFSFRHEPGKRLEYIMPEHKIAGVHRRYELNNGVYTQSAEDFVHIDGEGRLAYNSGERIFKGNGEERISVPLTSLAYPIIVPHTGLACR